MIGAWTHITVEATARTPFHIGTGAFDLCERPTKDGPRLVEVAQILVDGDGNPVLPGASVKGALRAMARASGADSGAVQDLFGPDSKQNARAPRAGRLICWMAQLAEDATARTRIEARTAIDPASGTAADRRLFHSQVVAPGARFVLRFALQTEAPASVSLLQTLLGNAAEQGLALGKGHGAGQGSFALDLDTLSVIRHDIDRARVPLSDDVSADWREKMRDASPPASGMVLTLTCDAAYISLDSMRDASHPGADEPANRLCYLREHGDPKKPQLSGATLKGALRARAVWLSRLRANDWRDNRDLILDHSIERSDPDLTEPGARVRSGAELSSTERLFGVNGWRGLLRVVSVRCTRCDGPVEVSSVKLDRFSGGPMHGALFTVEAARRPVFEARLALDGRCNWPNEDDEALLKRLLDDLASQGLMFGHGTNKGYGWFNVDVG